MEEREGQGQKMIKVFQIVVFQNGVASEHRCMTSVYKSLACIFVVGTTDVFADCKPFSHQRVELSAVPFEALMPSQHDADNQPLLGDSRRLHSVSEAAVNALPLPEDHVSGP